MSDEPVDQVLGEGIGPEAFEALTETARQHRRTYEHKRWLVNGRSRAPVAIVLERDERAARSRRLVLKVPTPDGGDPVDNEYSRHQDAYIQAPPGFVGHLAELVHEPIRISRGRWITLQGIAGDDVDSVEVLTVMLNSMLDVGTKVDPGYGPDEFAASCGALVHGVLADWNGPPHLASGSQTVAQFLRSHIHDQLAPGGRLDGPSRRNSAKTLLLPGEPDALPNPFELARGNLGGSAPSLRPIVGRTHGDLHTDNVLIRIAPPRDASAFHLIDLALYEPLGPLTRDPVHLLLYILARRMDQLSGPQQDNLISVLLDPVAGPRHRIEPWLAAVIDAIEGASAEWLKGSGLQPEWREQRLLSLVGNSLLFLGRTSTRDEDYPWFLRMAARATAAFLELHPVPEGVADPLPNSPRPLPWRPLEQPVEAGPPAAASVVGSVVGSARLWLRAVPTNGKHYESRLLADVLTRLPEIGRGAGLLAADDNALIVRPGGVTDGMGTGVHVAREGFCTVWTCLPHDGLGAVLDERDLAERLARLVAVAGAIGFPADGEVALEVGVDPRDPVAEGSVDNVPRTEWREPSSRTPVLVRGADSLPASILTVRGADIGAELAARLLAEFRMGKEPGR